MIFTTPASVANAYAGMLIELRYTDAASALLMAISVQLYLNGNRPQRPTCAPANGGGGVMPAGPRCVRTPRHTRNNAGAPNYPSARTPRGTLMAITDPA